MQREFPGRNNWPGQNRTCCLAVLYRGMQIEKRILEANAGGLHAEEKLLPALNRIETTPEHTLDLYIVNAPCDSCAPLILNYHRKHSQIPINIKVVSRYHENEDAIRCLRETNGITLEAFSPADWDTFSEQLNQSTALGPRVDINPTPLQREKRDKRDDKTRRKLDLIINLQQEDEEEEEDDEEEEEEEEDEEEEEGDEEELEERMRRLNVGDN